MGDIIRKICGADLDQKWRTQSKKAVRTPEPRELAASGFQRSQRLGVSEGCPQTPSHRTLHCGAPCCSLTPAAWQAPAQGEGVGAASGRPSKHGTEGTSLIFLFATGPCQDAFPLKKKQQKKTKTHTHRVRPNSGGKGPHRAFPRHPSCSVSPSSFPASALFWTASMFVQSSEMFVSWILYQVIRNKNKPHSRQICALCCQAVFLHLTC